MFSVSIRPEILKKLREDYPPGCKVELIQRDVYMIGPDPGKVKRYVELARQAMEEEWWG